MKNLKIVLREKITQKDYEEIKKLEKYCSSEDDVSFKLELEYKLSELKQKGEVIVNINDFMLYNDDMLIGYIGISDFGGGALEVNGMVHPDYRKRGIFKRLFSLVVDEWTKRKQQEMLLLCDNKSLRGIDFINSVGGAYDHSEYDMALNMELMKDLKHYNISLSEASMSEKVIVAEMDSIFFNMKVEADDEFIVENIENKTTFIARINDAIVGKVRLEISDGVGGIYGLGIVPELRGRGYGRELLLKSVQNLIERGSHKIILQVETKNKNALNLYKSCGFIENYVMDYYKITK